jgi:hypothetical protein
MVELVQILRIAPGRFEDFQKRRAQVKALRDRPGAPAARYMRITTGPNAGAVAVILSFENWQAFGEYNHKLRSDPAWRELVQTGRNDPNPAVTPGDVIITESLEL